MKITTKTLTTKDRFELDVVVFDPNLEAEKVLVMCHGLTSEKDGRNLQLLYLAEAMVEQGFRVVRFDFRGHGKSSGTDLDINIESLVTDLDCVIQGERKQLPIYLFGFSFGGFTVSEYLQRTHLDVQKVVFWSPALDPNNSSFENNKAFCYQEIFDAKLNGSLERDGYVLWKSKGFRVSKSFVEEVKDYNFRRALESLPKQTFILQGRNDRNVDKDYNEKYAKEYNLKYKEYEASHSLNEQIDEAINDTVEYFIS